MKRNKVVAAIVVNAILLIFIIVGVLIAQVVEISVLTRRKKQLMADLEYYEQVLDTSEDYLERLQADEEYRKTIIQLAQMGVSVTPKDFLVEE